MSRPEVVVANHQAEDIKPTTRSYVVGFGLSVGLTMLAYLVVTMHWMRGQAALILVSFLAVTQFAVQVLCFLHVGGEQRPRRKLLFFVSMLIVILILVGGSLWIMNNLNYHMNSQHLNQYLHDQDRL